MRSVDARGPAPRTRGMAKPIWKLEVGEPAPDFRLRATGQGAGRGEKFTHVSLSDYRGKKNVVLAFIPAAFTPV